MADGDERECVCVQLCAATQVTFLIVSTGRKRERGWSYYREEFFEGGLKC